MYCSYQYLSIYLKNVFTHRKFVSGYFARIFRSFNRFYLACGAVLRYVSKTITVKTLSTTVSIGALIRCMTTGTTVEAMYLSLQWHFLMTRTFFTYRVFWLVFVNFGLSELFANFLVALQFILELLQVLGIVQNRFVIPPITYCISSQLSTLPREAISFIHLYSSFSLAFSTHEKSH